jgi:hypothetical protein
MGATRFARREKRNDAREHRCLARPVERGTRPVRPWEAIESNSRSGWLAGWPAGHGGSSPVIAGLCAERPGLGGSVGRGIPGILSLFGRQTRHAGGTLKNEVHVTVARHGWRLPPRGRGIAVTYSVGSSGACLMMGRGEICTGLKTCASSCVHFSSACVYRAAMARPGGWMHRRQ